MVKKFLIIILISASLVINFRLIISNAQENENFVYVVFDEDGNFLFERQNVIVGDEYINSNLEQYIVYYIDKESQTGKAKFVKKINLPKIKKIQRNSKNEKPKINIGLYMTHNDESYIYGDGYDSIYGAGGIHDITKLLKTNLIERGCEVYLDETLHIPHDTKAYLRSESTATKLLDDYNVDFLYDIHRDGASRKTYVTNYEGKDFCKVRIVVGKANANFEEVRNYALYMVSIAKMLHPILFLDVYLASGNYNQFLLNNALLFEMGSHLVEKELVAETVPKLADVIVQTNKNIIYSDYEEEEQIEVSNPSPILPPDNTLNENNSSQLGNLKNENDQNSTINTNQNNTQIDQNNSISNSKITSNNILIIYIIAATIIGVTTAYLIIKEKKKR